VTEAPTDGSPYPPVTGLVSVVIPARDEEKSIAELVAAVIAQESLGAEIEVIVVDDHSSDGTVEAARAAGARVVTLGDAGMAGVGPATARNRGAAASHGDPIVFLDADCTPSPGWLEGFLRAHERGEVVVGGALDLPPGLPLTARCDYYCGWYLVHSGRDAGVVPHHPPPNLSVRRDAFLGTSGFTEAQPFAYTNEERQWQAELRRRGHRIWFEPAAAAWHHNRPGFANLLRRNYRWAYTSLESKGTTGSARMSGLYRYPRLMILGSVLLAPAHAAYILGCWIRAGVFEPLLMLPAILASRFAYAAGMAVGGTHWLLRRGEGRPRRAPRWS
jgi:glycosyltransferase involved in cell wall biosynthesis